MALHLACWLPCTFHATSLACWVPSICTRCAFKSGPPTTELTWMGIQMIFEIFCIFSPSSILIPSLYLSPLLALSFSLALHLSGLFFILLTRSTVVNKLAKEISLFPLFRYDTTGIYIALAHQVHHQTELTPQSRTTSLRPLAK
uniref:Secreted protein n=1 Tax=Anopheles darlingi TaxID=43151 RepID=A0A2M4D2V7_ANODA